MRFLLATDHVDDVSTVINKPNFERLNLVDGVSIDFFRRDYENYDVILFMGYDPDIAGVRRVNPRAKVGVVDLRPLQIPAALGADFVVVNGLEMRDQCAAHFDEIYTYYIYPRLAASPRIHARGDRLILGYHGNKIHLQTMHPDVSSAIQRLAQEYEVEIWAIYNVDVLGRIDGKLFGEGQVRVRCIQWSIDALESYVPQMDIGLVPNRIPIPDEAEAKNALPTWPEMYNEHESDLLIRFKATSNPGRVFVFSQCGVPVIADMYPSALDVIRDGENGYVAASEAGWYRALRLLAASPARREEFGHRLHAEVRGRYDADTINQNLVNFIDSLH